MAIDQARLAKEFLTCAICFGLYDRPRVLSCQHTFCYGCLERCVKRKNSRTLACPVCRKKTTIPEKGVAGFGANYEVLGMLQIIKGNSKASRGECSGTSAAAAAAGRKKAPSAHRSKEPVARNQEPVARSKIPAPSRRQTAKNTPAAAAATAAKKRVEQHRHQKAAAPATTRKPSSKPCVWGDNCYRRSDTNKNCFHRKIEFEDSTDSDDDDSDESDSSEEDSSSSEEDSDSSSSSSSSGDCDLPPSRCCRNPANRRAPCGKGQQKVVQVRSYCRRKK